MNNEDKLFADKMADVILEAEDYIYSFDTFNALPEDGDDEYQWTSEQYQNELRKSLRMLEKIVTEYNTCIMELWEKSLKK